MKTYYDYGTVTTLNDGDYIPIAPATPGTYKKILWSSIKSLIYSIIYPVGSYYVQYPAASSNDAATAFPSAYSPASLYGGTWELMYSTEGIVFQTESYDGAGRTSGLMEDQLQGHWHIMTTSNGMIIVDGSAGSYSGFEPAVVADVKVNRASYSGRGVITDGTNGTPRTGTRTSHRNRLMRVYKRRKTT